MHNDATDYAKSCDVCQRIRKPSQRDEMSLVPQIAVQPFDKSVLVLGNRADPGLILLCRTNKRPTVLALSATTYVQVAVSPETAMGCRRIRFLQAERDITVP